MIRTVLLDTGPLVALLNRRDRYHRWSTEQWADIALPVLSCEPVLTEACFLLRELAGGPSAILELVGRGAVKIAYGVEAEVDALGKLMTRYADVPMSLADACLVRMVERHPGAMVLTLDRDFRVYRSHGRRVISTIMPSDL
ncbi:MAG: PIN domain-containing protein [Candidatus Rokubacteria bacterium]|nr:PIN domain-containing protein [Candidatus Rokubacteria bacterium]